MALSCMKMGLKVPPRVQDPGSNRQSQGRTRGALSPSSPYPRLGYSSWKDLPWEHTPRCPGHGEALPGSAATQEPRGVKHIQAGSRQRVASPGHGCSNVSISWELEPRWGLWPARRATSAGTRGPAQGDARGARRTSLPRCAGCWCAMAARAALPEVPGSVLPWLQPTSATQA